MGKDTITLNKAVGSTVTVACKVPMGLVLKLYKKTRQHEPVMGGGSREIDAYVPDHSQRTYIIHGNSHPQDKSPIAQIADSFALTHGIPKAFWDAWLEQNLESDMVRNGLIFAHVEGASVAAEAREKASERSGLERLDPTKVHKDGETVIERAEV